MQKFAAALEEGEEELAEAQISLLSFCPCLCLYLNPVSCILVHIHIHTYVSKYLSVCLIIQLSVHLSVSLSVYLSVSIYLSISIHLRAYIFMLPPLRSMDFRLLGRGRLKGFSNSLISNAVSMKIHCTGS